MVTDLTGMEIANASLLDESTAAAEAMAMQFALRTNKEANAYFVSDDIFPQTLDVLKPALLPWVLPVARDHRSAELHAECSERLFNTRGNGEVHDYSDFSARCHEEASN
nr:hypothetical protein [Anseongella ginsenosidimutans]